MEEIYNYMLEFGFKKEEIDKIIKTYPINSMLSSSLLKSAKDSFNNFLNNGYDNKQIIRMIVNCPQLFIHKNENINKKLDGLLSLGFSKEQVLKITVALPNIYGYTMEYINQKIDVLMSYDYTKEQALQMALILPALYSYSVENIQRKLNFYKETELEFIALECTKYLMQSVELSYARYNYFKDKGIVINREKYKYLFYSEKDFSKQFGVSKKELLLRYPYEEEKEKEIVR